MAYEIHFTKEAVKDVKKLTPRLHLACCSIFHGLALIGAEHCHSPGLRRQFPTAQRRTAKQPADGVSQGQERLSEPSP